MPFGIWHLQTIRINGQINRFGCRVKIVEVFRGAAENIETSGDRAELICGCVYLCVFFFFF